jgi:hypothetical protein
MSLNNNTIPQVLYNTPDPFSQPSEMYFINGIILDTATDAEKTPFTFFVASGPPATPQLMTRERN